MTSRSQSQSQPQSELQPQTSSQSTKSQLRHKSWTKDQYLISTDYKLIPAHKVNEAFASERVYWTKPVPEAVMRSMLENSLCFGLFVVKDGAEGGGVELTPTLNSSSTASTNTAAAAAAADDDNNNDEEGMNSNYEFIGLARCMTDFVTILYLTDVFVEPSKSGLGLGRWMMSCIKEVADSMPHLRRTLLFTNDWGRSVPFYRETLGMEVIQSRMGSDGVSGEGVAVMYCLGRGNSMIVEKNE